MKTIKTIIIDDEPLAIEVIENLASQIPFLEIIGSFQHPLDAILFLQNNEVDLVFCDIEMPQINGLEIVKFLEKSPIFIMITAYRDFAIDSFEVGVFDYLVKPVRMDRFLKAVNKAKEFIGLKSHSEIQQVNDDRIFIKTEGKLVKILLHEIVYIEAQGDYLKFVLKDQSYSTQATLKSIEETLVFQSFFRVQRSFIINLEAVRSIHGNLVELTTGTQISIAPNKKEELLRLLGIK
ncbi:two component transcriptional regulator, LytTR family [Soonwooa buanensis]|uniref:Two component transcriptional regulator, LytTR family n=1 Tax=Soonwooa buanensis TaxID=619805 RepID=A0A1T5CES0_9FLAO|nr:LytTR family DNA-binding domain-containing protein [Soonwooa buanensis]SKB57978.1 two component transcriptional regulator, LytTR family [Soonwooa buanensis]